MSRLPGFLLMSMAMSGTALGQESTNTGASMAWTSTDKTLQRARDLVARGELAEAQRSISAATDGPADELRDLIARLRWEYSLDEEGLLRKLRAFIPDVTSTDLQRWREGGEVQHRTIDGKLLYFRREPSNIFRFSADAKNRRDAQARKTAKPAPAASWELQKHLREVIDAAEESGESLVMPVRHICRYTLTIPANHPRAKPGALVRCWLPFPQEHQRQARVKLIRTSTETHQLTPSGAPHRSIYLEQRVADPSKPITFAIEFEYVALASYPALDEVAARPLPSSYAQGNLLERPPHIVFTPELKQIVREAVGEEKNPLLQARRIFAWIDANIRYCAEEEYCLIPSFAEKALRTREGDCGIQATLFIAMCRFAGIPARWQSGWQTKPSGLNMHDWAEFYVEPWGWLPVDPSYGLQDSPDPKVRWFYFGHQDSYRMIVNLDYGAPLTPPKLSLRSEPADFQRGEVEIDGKNLYFNEWDYEMKIERPAEK